MSLSDSIFPVSAAAVTHNLPAPIAVDRALIALVRLLARQAVRDWLAQAQMTTVKDADATTLRSAVSAGERP